MVEPVKRRCAWAGSDDPLMVAYHDLEWGVPLHDDRALFELLILEGAQAGLSWRTVLHKRQAYRAAFHGFDAQVVSRYKARDVRRCMANAGIIRNRLKILSTIQNAKAFLAIQAAFGSFDAYIWGLAGGKPIQNAIKTSNELPSKTVLSDQLSRDLLKRGFTFVGSTICYSFMQASGIVNDHEVRCGYRRPGIRRRRPVLV